MLLDIAGVAEMLICGPSRARTWLAKNGIAPALTFGGGVGGGYRWLREDVERVIRQSAEQAAQAVQASERVRHARKTVFDMPRKEALRVISEGKGR